MAQLELKNLDAVLSSLNISVSKSTEYYYDALYELSTTIFKKCLEMGLNQSQFAKLLGVSQVMVSKYESGDYNFTIKQLCDLAEKLDMDITLLLNNTKKERSK